MMHTILHEIMLLVYYGAVTGVLNAIIGRKSQIDAWCEARPYVSAALKLLRSVGFDPWQMVQALTLASKKRLPMSMQTVDNTPIKPVKGVTDAPAP